MSYKAESHGMLLHVMLHLTASIHPDGVHDFQVVEELPVHIPGQEQVGDSLQHLVLIVAGGGEPPATGLSEYPNIQNR